MIKDKDKDRTCAYLEDDVYEGEQDIIGMEELFIREKKLQEKLYGSTWPWRDIDLYIREYSIHTIVEVVEMLRETNYKQQKRKRAIDIDKLKEECADVFLMALALSTAVYSSYDELLAEIKNKMDKNLVRRDWDINNK